MITSYSLSPNEPVLHFQISTKYISYKSSKCIRHATHFSHVKSIHNHCQLPPLWSCKSVHVNIYCKLSEVKWTLKPFARNTILQVLLACTLKCICTTTNFQRRFSAMEQQQVCGEQQNRIKPAFLLWLMVSLNALTRSGLFHSLLLL